MVNAKSVVLSSTKPVSSFLFKNKSMLNSTVSLSPILVMSAAASLAFSAPAMAQQQNAQSTTLQADNTSLNIDANSNTNTSAAINTASGNQPLSSNLTDQLIQKANQKNLATHPTWLRLHYYEPDQKAKAPTSTKQRTYKSKIEKPEFFISEQGKTDPQAELEAFIKATVTQGVDGDDSVACRFPARTYWLKEQLGLEQVQPNCPDFDAWLKNLDPQKLSVVFAEEYPDRPVSAFGHTLMLIDSTASLADPKAIDKAHALNDTVAGNPDDSFIKYAINSAFGGYPNDITIEPYPQKLADYLQNDNRDVWTYGLNLTKAEVQQIMRHVYETKDLELPYYFTMDNCASEILRYIDVVRPNGNLLDEFTLAVVPSDVVRLLQKEGLIDQQNYFPSDKTLAQAKLNNSQFTQLPSSSIDANHQLIPTQLTPVDNNPLDAHSLQRMKIGAGAQDDTGYISLAYRGGFNDPLDRPSGYPQNFHLEAGSVELRVYKDDEKSKGDHSRVELQELAILRGRSFNPINTAKKGDSLFSSWGVNVQATQVKDGSQMNNNNRSGDPDSSHLVGSFGYEKGISAAFGSPQAGSGQLPPQVCYALGTGLAQVGKGLSKGYRVGAGVNLGCRYQFSPNARLIGEVQVPYWYHGSTDNDQIKGSYWQPILSLGAQYDLDRNKAIRIQGSYELQDGIEGRDDIQLAYVTYF